LLKNGTPGTGQDSAIKQDGQTENAEIYLHENQTGRFALRNGLFQLAKRTVLEREKACFAAQNGLFCNPLIIR